MRRSVPVRVGLILAVFSLLVTILGFEGVAAAGSPDVSCPSFTANTSGHGSVTNCTDVANTGGSGTLVISVKSLKGTITWNGTGTTKYTDKEKTVTPNLCTGGAIEIASTATVTKGTGAAGKSIKKGNKATTDICYNKTTTVVTLAPGEADWSI